MVWILFRHSFLSLQEGVWNRDFEINIGPSINHHGQNDVLWKEGFFKPSPLNWTSFTFSMLCKFYLHFLFYIHFCKNLSSLYHHLKSFSFYAKKSHVKMSLVFPIGRIFSNKPFSQILKKKNQYLKKCEVKCCFSSSIREIPTCTYFCVHWT